MRLARKVRLCTASSIAAIGALMAAVTFAQQAPGRQGGPPAGVPQGPYPFVTPLPAPDAPREFQTISQPIRVVPFVRGLASPWSIAFLPNGDMLVTERVGRLRIVRSGTLDPQPIAGVPQVHQAT